MRALRFWNGRDICCRNYTDPRYKNTAINTTLHCSVAAYSRADARRVIESYTGRLPSDAELRDYWSECWGSNMDGVPRERGLWIEFERGVPTKVA